MKKNRPLLLFLLVLLFVPSLLFAEVAEEKREQIVFDLMGGLNLLDISNLNSALRANGFRTFDKFQPNIGLGFYGVVGGRTVGGFHFYGFTKEDSTSTHFQRLRFLYGMLDVGYVVFSRGGFRVFPMFGLGVGSIDLRITEKGSLAFADIMTDPKRESHFETLGFMFEGMLGIDYIAQLGDYLPIVLGIYAGYVQSVPWTGWKMMNIDIDGGPKSGISGPSVHIFIGFAFTIK